MSGFYKLGADFSSFQNKVIWPHIKDPVDLFGHLRPVDFVTLKVSEGYHTIDAMCHSHAAGALSQKLPKGYYHFGRTHSDFKHSSDLQARIYATQLLTLPPADLHLIQDVNGKPMANHWLDLETNDAKLSPADYEQWVQTFIDTFLGIRPDDTIGIYGGAYFLNENLRPTHTLGKYPLWLSGYEKENQLIIPHGWKEWVGWQFTGKGTIPAVSGPVDLDFVK